MCASVLTRCRGRVGGEAAAVRGARGGPRRGVSAPGGSLDRIPSPYRENQTMQDTIDLWDARKPTSPRTAAMHQRPRQR